MSQQRIVDDVSFGIKPDEHRQGTSETAGRGFYRRTDKVSVFRSAVYLIHCPSDFHLFRQFGRVIVKAGHDQSDGIAQCLGIGLGNRTCGHIVDPAQQRPRDHRKTGQRQEHVFQ